MTFFPDHLSEACLDKYFSSLLFPLGMHCSRFSFNLLTKHTSSLYQRGREVLQKVQEAVNTSQAWIYLSRGEPKDTPIHPACYPRTLCSLQCGMQWQHLRTCLQVSAPGCVLCSTGTTYRGGQERWKLSLSEVCLTTGNKKCLSHQPVPHSAGRVPCSSSLMKGGNELRVSRWGECRQNSRYKRNDFKGHGRFS